jgi:hypothetical protein
LTGLKPTFAYLSAKPNAMHMKTSGTPSGGSPRPFGLSLTLVIVLLAFLLLAWGIWWYFEWRIQSLDRQLEP